MENMLRIILQYEKTPLHYASYHGQLAVVELLIRLRADVNGVDRVSYYVCMCLLLHQVQRKQN